MNDDLQRPLVLDYEHFLLALPDSYGAACIHGVTPQADDAPYCGSIARSDLSTWPRLDRRLVEYLFRTEAPGSRRFYFCLNCIASNSHPLAVS